MNCNIPRQVSQMSPSASNETYKCDRRVHYTENVDPDDDYCSKGERVDES